MNIKKWITGAAAVVGLGGAYEAGVHEGHADASATAATKQAETYGKELDLKKATLENQATSDKERTEQTKVHADELAKEQAIKAQQAEDTAKIKKESEEKFEKEFPNRQVLLMIELQKYNLVEDKKLNKDAREVTDKVQKAKIKELFSDYSTWLRFKTPEEAANSYNLLEIMVDYIGNQADKGQLSLSEAKALLAANPTLKKQIEGLLHNYISNKAAISESEFGKVEKGSGEEKRHDDFVSFEIDNIAQLLK